MNMLRMSSFHLHSLDLKQNCQINCALMLIEMIVMWSSSEDRIVKTIFFANKLGNNGVYLCVLLLLTVIICRVLQWDWANDFTTQFILKYKSIAWVSSFSSFFYFKKYHWYSNLLMDWIYSWRKRRDEEILKMPKRIPSFRDHFDQKSIDFTYVFNLH